MSGTHSRPAKGRRFIFSFTLALATVVLTASSALASQTRKPSPCIR